MSVELEDATASARQELEPSIARMLDRKASATTDLTPYVPVGPGSIAGPLTEFLRQYDDNIAVGQVEIMTGGASKEQYSVEVLRSNRPPERVVLRLDALQSVMETDRLREFDALRLVAPHVDVPEARWVDPNGSTFGRPFLVTSFVTGVAKPTGRTNDSVSGLQTDLDDELRIALSSQFVDRLARIHAVPITEDTAGSLGIPDSDPLEAARWQVNWWTRVWHDDSVAAFPLVAVIEEWLYENLPAHDGLAVVHGDYRTGNYLFDENTRTITSILDWELAHIGDHHEDLGWAVQRMYSTPSPDGGRLVTGLMPKDEFLRRYEEASGRRVSPESLHYYEILCAFKSLVATLASSVRAAKDNHSHQDVLLSWLASCGYVFAADICDLIDRGVRP
ncbi:phosphotransferase family protein [Rhodococcoides kyotonense]|uniref:Predicted kinase, aminoglycoside phosphotransferase (APT) family n=1 Tax=Rhodococcoides kyotonense TaxID=398843 RepID=A0A239K2A1_9NOCA|nr:phosphotransferase family protein [Rhodococcus kyotonensis]SNT12507.1 Predicted kinase, aminoglycoside phosphotransferase (APT) family [Rhodococcus kyotonensis]